MHASPSAVFVLLGACLVWNSLDGADALSFGNGNRCFRYTNITLPAGQTQTVGFKNVGNCLCMDAQEAAREENYYVFARSFNPTCDATNNDKFHHSQFSMARNQMWCADKDTGNQISDIVEMTIGFMNYCAP